MKINPIFGVFLASFTSTVLMSGMALGQGGSFSQKKGAQTMNISIPIINLGETTLHGEFNLAGQGGLALEILNKGVQEEAPKNDPDSNSRLTRAQAISFIYSVYNDPMAMAGFYWGVGAGYRTESVDWLKPDKSLSTALSPGVDPNYTSRLADLKGPTAHGRFGYRYVGKDVPLLIGAYLGLRHFASTVTDQEGTSQVRKEKNSPAATQSLAPLNAEQMTESEKSKIHDIYATRGEGGVEIGFSF